MTGCGAAIIGPIQMRLLGFFLVPAGWVIVLAAIALLRVSAAQGVFLLAGVAIQAVGLTLVFRYHLPHTPDRRKP